MAVDKGANTLQVDTNVLGRERDGSFSSILKAKDSTRSNVSQQSEALHETTTAMGALNNQVEQFLNTLKQANLDVSKLEGFKEFQKSMKSFDKSFNDSRLIVNRGSTDLNTLTKRVEESSNAYDDLSVNLEVLKAQYDEETKQLKALSKEKKKQLDLDKADLRNRKEIRAQQSKQIAADAKEGNKSVLKSIQTQAGKLHDILSKIDIRHSLDQLVQASGRSNAANIQLSMMNSYGLTKSEFNSFKKQLYKQIDTSIYNSNDVKATIASLEEIGINTKEEAVDKFNTIIRGQQLLGLTTEQQAKLQTISNRTGRDHLTFVTNKMAKIMQESNNINKKQLSELVSLNSNLISQFADIGISSEAFENASYSATAALTELMGGDSGLAQKYSSIMTDLAVNNNASGSKLGLGLQDYYSQLESGTNLATMVGRGQGTLGMLYNDIMSGKTNASTMSELVNQGVINANERDFLTHMTNYDKQNGKGSFANYLDSFKGTDNGEALSKTEENTKEATSFLGQITNKFTNWVASSFDWVDFSNFESTMKVIITLLGIIASSEIISSIGSVVKLFGKGIGKIGSKMMGSNLVQGLAGSKAMSWMGTGGLGNGLSLAGGLAGGAMLAGGLIWGGIDAYKGYNDTAEAMYGKDATTGQRIAAGAASFVSGSKVHRNKEGNVDVGKNAGRGALNGAGKGALIGAGIGTFIGGPAGTLVGGAIGGVVGGIAGAIGGWFKGKKAKEQEEREKKELEYQQAIKENTAKVAQQQAITNAQLTLNKTAKVRAYTGVGSSGGIGAVASSSAKPIDSYTNNLLRQGLIGMGASNSTGIPWSITSPFGPRTLSNGDSSYHNGVDFGIKTGTPIGAPVSGKISFVQIDNRNTYPNGPSSAGTGINLQGSDGKMYQFWHLSDVGVTQGQEVTAGYPIGLSGNTGYSTGAHLHFGVKVGGQWVNPLNGHLTQGLFTPDGKFYSTVTSSQNSSSATTEPTTYENKVSSLAGGVGMGAVVNGLAEIKNTLIELSNRQSRDEQLMSMLQGNKKQDPRTA